MSLAQTELFPSPQQDLFGDPERAAQPAYQVKPEHVRNRLVEMLAALRAAEGWPWPATTTSLYRETVWPYLFGLLDSDEAARWQADFAAEVERREAA